MTGRLTLEALADAVAAGRVEEVIVALPDLQGRLKGSRLDARYFLDVVVAGGFGACVYLLAADVDMRPRPGPGLDPAEAGFGDFVVAPDPATLRTLPWEDATALVIGDARWRDGTPVAVAPRQVLRGQLAALEDLGLVALAATELEFLVFGESYADAAARGYAGLSPATRHNVDYALEGTEDLDRVARRIRRAMVGAGLELESARGECHPGQYEIVFRYRDALGACDDHIVYKSGAKRIAAQEGVALSFMAKYDDGEGSSCHVHLSLRSADGTHVFAADGGGPSRLMEHFVAGQLTCLPQLTLLFAPNVNSYKRLQPGSFAPTSATWGADDRTCAVRVVGEGGSLRIEHRVGGADANPYLAVAGILAAGLHGIRHRVRLPPPSRGAGGTAAGAPLPATLRDAVAAFEASAVARKAFGDAVVGHYAATARAELAAFERAVTDWERVRGFERL